MLDDFNRANGGLGANWLSSPSFLGIAITGNQVVNAGSTWQMAYWNPATNAAPNDHYAQVRCVAGSFMGPVVRHQLGVSSGYFVFFNTGGGGGAYLYKFTNGSFAALVTGMGSVKLGDVLKLQVTGNVLEVFVNGVSQGTFTDNSFPSGGQPGIAVNSGTLDDFDAGPFATATLWQGSAGFAGAGAQAAPLQTVMPVTAAALIGTGALTAQTAQWHKTSTQLSGAGALTSLANLIESMAGVMAGRGAMPVMLTNPADASLLSATIVGRPSGGVGIAGRMPVGESLTGTQNRPGLSGQGDLITRRH